MGINLSISNIAWEQENDQSIYKYMKKKGFSGLEIAPTRLFSDNPYEKLEEAIAFSKRLYDEYGIKVCSLQSIWYGRSEEIFKSIKDRQKLLNYTKKAIDFAEAIGARNLVFGCPKNRNTDSVEDRIIAIEFFKILGDYAAEHGSVLAMEANPVIYGTNFINTTKDAIELIKEVDSKGFKLNLDFGTIIYNKENIESFVPYVELINHVHISEPNLVTIRKRIEHRTLLNILHMNKFSGYVSIEMSKSENLMSVMRTIDYLKKISEVDGIYANQE